MTVGVGLDNDYAFENYVVPDDKGIDEKSDQVHLFYSNMYKFFYAHLSVAL